MILESFAKYYDLEHASYNEACLMLQKKYGLPSGSYFTDESCLVKNTSIRRVSEGLFIHHIDEYNPTYPFATGISSTNQAKQYPFELQKPDHLCYCNYIEHCLLHLKIYDIRRREMNIAGRIYPLDDGLTRFILPELIELYFGNGEVKDRKDSYFEAIKDDRIYFAYLYDNFQKAYQNIPKHIYNIGDN